jgi:hypothetical protein
MPAGPGSGLDMRDFAIIASMTLPMQIAGLTLLFIDEAAISAACVIGMNLAVVGLAIVRDDIARLSRALRQDQGNRGDILMDYDPVPDGTEVVAWF